MSDAVSTRDRKSARVSLDSLSVIWNVTRPAPKPLASARPTVPTRHPGTSRHPRKHRMSDWWRRLDSNQRRRKANRFTVCPL
jgi:hypothetical protein